MVVGFQPSAYQLSWCTSRCCSECGAVLSDIAFSSDVQFTKDATGAAAPSTRFVRDGATISGRVGRDGREYGPSVTPSPVSIAHMPTCPLHLASGGLQAYDAARLCVWLIQTRPGQPFLKTPSTPVCCWFVVAQLHVDSNDSHRANKASALTD